jgi:hypothetical protein
VKHIAHIVLITIVAGVFFALLVFVEENLVLYDMIVPTPDMTLEEWLEDFRVWGELGIGLAFAAGLLWYVLGQWVFKINNWQASGKRPVWALLFLLSVAGGVVTGIVLTRQAQEGAVIAYGFYALNGLLCYYLETALFSPTSFKYTPLGARKLRRWNLAF